MKITFAESAKADIVGFIVDEGDRLPQSAAALDKASGGLLSEALEGSRFDGKAGQSAIIVLPKGSDARRAVLIGGGKPKKRDARVLENIGAHLVRAIASSGFKTASIAADDAESAARVAAGAKLAAYRFDSYFTKLKADQKPSLTGLTVVTPDPKGAKAAYAPLDAATDGTYLARDLVNLPPNDLYPESFAGKIKELAAPPEEREMDLLIPPAPEMGNIGVEPVSAGAKVGDGDNERWLFRNLKLSLKPGQCTGIVGRNGVGKTTLLRLCMGEREPDSGSVTVGKRVVFNYIDQARMQLNYGGTVMDQVADRNEIVHFGDQKLTARAYLKRFLFEGERVKERIDRLSGGERARLMLAKVLKTGGNPLVLDEPTNDLDLRSLRMLEEALADFGGSVIVVSHDRYFLDRICDRIIAFEDNGVHITPGNYSYYLEKRQQRENSQRIQAAAAAKEAAARKKAKAPSDDKPRKLTLAEKKELETIEDRIMEAEEAAAAVESKLNDPDFQLNHFNEVPKVVAELEAAKQATAKLYARWEELEALSK